jgi:predicted CXXCH cytochrome family protein
MKCSTCHDPHQSVHGLSQQDHIQNCIQCHDTDDSSHTICPVSAKTNCIECHMPKVSQEQGIEFHDHWIRVHEE